ncbi:MAG: oligosaccharyl transferase, archaeosortase A system-associated [Thermoplasmatota archaeon]
MDWRTWVRRVGPWLEAIFLVVVVWWMLQVRLSPYPRFASVNSIIDSDSYYHWRAAFTSAQDFPHALRFDPWTYFPFGTATGQFGTLYDIIIAAAIIATGNPSDPIHALHVVMQAAPYFGAATAIPVYLLARRMGGRIAAIWSVLLLAILPGEVFLRSLAGYADHDVAEVLFSTFALFGVLWTVQSGRMYPTVSPWRAFAPAIAGGVSLFLYLWVWPPGVMIVALLGLWILFELLIDHTRGIDTRGFAYGVAIAFVIAAVLFLPLVEKYSFDFNLFSLLQPLALAAVAGMAIIIDAISEVGDRRGAPRYWLPLGTGILVVVSFIAVALFVPPLFAVLKWGFSWVTGIGATQNFNTIQEAAPSCTSVEAWPFCAKFTSDYGWTLLSALLAIPFLVWEIVRRHKPGDFLLLIWLIFMAIAASSRLVFNEYLAVAVAVANGWLVSYAARATGLTAAAMGLFSSEEPVKRKSGRRARMGKTVAEFKWYQPVAVVVAAAFILPGLILPAQGTTVFSDVAAQMAPDSESRLWDLASQWVANNTPPVGVDFSKAYGYEPSGQFHYPANAYGILAWWDYGHEIEIFGHRPPIANDFQQAAPFASRFFTDPTESQAEADIHGYSSLTNANPYALRYVMISDADALGKYGAITVWANIQNGSRADFGQGDTVKNANFSGKTVQEISTGYTDTMMYRLYFDNAQGLSHYRLIYVYPGWNCIGGFVDQNGNQAVVNDEVTSGLCPGESGNGSSITVVRDPNSYLPFSQTPGQYFLFNYVNEPSLKIFEHVPGATLRGNGTPNVLVTASVTLDLHFGSSTVVPFQYSQSTTIAANGTWALTVPYSTCQTDCVPISQGGSTLEVKTAGPFTVSVGSTVHSVNVSDSAVLHGGTVTV